MCTQIGYFYPADDLGRGAQLLQYVLEAHDDLWSSWRVRQRRHIEQYLATNPSLVRIYDQLLVQLLDRLPEQQPVLW
jgi:hypothetical protein